MKQDFSDYDISEAMLRFGGGFASTLGLLWRKADDVNRGRLRDAFEDYFEEYADPAMHAAMAKERAS